MTHQNIIELDTVERYNDILGIPTRHPLVNIIDLSQFEHIAHVPTMFGIHMIACYYDNNPTASQEFVATMKFFAPGQYDHSNTDINHRVNGWVLVFDDKVAIDTIYENRVRDFSFFNSTKTNTIRLRESEAKMVINCFRSIDMELNNEIDIYSSRILISSIAVLLSISTRYYHQRNQNPKDTRQSVMARLNNILDEYLRKTPSSSKEIPTVSTIAKQMGTTPNYVGDTVRKHAGCSAHDYIRGFVMKEARRLLIYSKLNINTIAYNMGYKYPHHFTRVFKQEYGITPLECRAKHKEELSQEHL